MSSVYNEPIEAGRPIGGDEGSRPIIFPHSVYHHLPLLQRILSASADEGD